MSGVAEVNFGNGEDVAVHCPIINGASFRPLVTLLTQVLLNLHTGLDNPEFYLTIDDVPRWGGDRSCFLWHVRMAPRLTNPAGFEFGNGMSINTVLLEDAFAFLDEMSIADIACARETNERPAKSA